MMYSIFQLSVRKSSVNRRKIKRFYITTQLYRLLLKIRMFYNNGTNIPELDASFDKKYSSVMLKAKNKREKVYKRRRAEQIKKWHQYLKYFQVSTSDWQCWLNIPHHDSLKLIFSGRKKVCRNFRTLFYMWRYWQPGLALFLSTIFM